MSALAATFDKALAGEAGLLLLANLDRGKSVGEPVGRLQTRRVLLVQPVMDYTQLQPGAAASNAIRAAARSLGLDPSHGVSIRLTGPVPLGDEEFASLAAGLALGGGGDGRLHCWASSGWRSILHAWCSRSW